MKYPSELIKTLVSNVLDAHLQAVATKDVSLLRTVFSSDALFIGTDDTEQWSLDQLSDLLESSDNGWDMTKCAERTIYLVDGQFSKHAAMFFEVVVHEKYGPLRGSGIVVKGSDENWRIAQYILSFSVPNDVLDTTNILELLAW